MCFSGRLLGYDPPGIEWVMSEEQKEVTYCDAEKAFHDGSYRAASEEELRALHQACLKVGGQNATAVDRIRRVGDIMWQELSARKARRESADAVAVADCPGGPKRDSTKEGSVPEDASWDEKRVHNLIANSVEESLTLEYKAAAALSRDSKPVMQITKDTSAMANSAGGVLIYGVAEDQASRQLRLDPVDRQRFPREWLDRLCRKCVRELLG